MLEALVEDVEERDQPDQERDAGEQAEREVADQAEQRPGLEPGGADDPGQ